MTLIKPQLLQPAGGLPHMGAIVPPWRPAFRVPMADTGGATLVTGLDQDLRPRPDALWAWFFRRPPGHAR